MVKTKTMLEKIEELEAKGWTYVDGLRLQTHRENCSVEVKAMVKDDMYRYIDIENNVIKPAKPRW